LLINNYN